jgi:hypothetical protein
MNARPGMNATFEESLAAVERVAPALPAKLVRVPWVQIDEILTKDEFLTLARHMLSGNPISHFLTVWRDEGEGTGRFAKARPGKRYDVQASWAYDSIAGKSKCKTSIGFYPKNQDDKSTFAAIDIDAHSGEDEIARGCAIRAFSLLLEYRDRYLILSASGRGYHVFIFANEPRPVAEWTRMLKDVADTIPLEIADGQCELFPSEDAAKHKVGKAIRMPGTYNPNTDSVELIIAETIRPLLDRIQLEKVENPSTLISNNVSPRQLITDREANSYSYSNALPSWTEEHAPKEKLCLLTKIASKSLAKSRSFASTSTDNLIERILLKYPIKQKSTRNGVLVKLAGELFCKFGYELSEAIVEAHYVRNESNINTSLDEHRREFEALWQYIINKTIDTFSASEQAIYDQLNTDPQREAFFIVRSFAHLRNGEDFSIAQLSLADRLSITQPGAKCVIDRLIDLRAIKKTADARINSQAAHYRWIANQDELPNARN